jgi:hypothetical protein
MKPRKLRPQEIYEQTQIARAAYFTACQFKGVGVYDTRRAETQAEAEALALAAGGRWMIYAVTPEGWTVHVRNIDPARQ